MVDRPVRYGAQSPEAPRRLTLEEADLDPFALYGQDDDPLIDIDVTLNGERTSINARLKVAVAARITNWICEPYGRDNSRRAKGPNLLTHS